MKTSKIFLLKYMAKSWYMYVFGITSLIICQYYQALMPKVTASAIDLMNSKGFSLSGIWSISKIMLIYAVIIAITRSGWRFFLHGSARRINAKVRRNIFESVLSYDDRFFKENKIGDLMTNFTSDLNILRHAASMGVVHVVEALCMITIVLWLLFLESPEMAMYVVLPYPIVSVMITIVSIISRHHYQRIQKQFGVVSQLVQDTFSGIGVVKTFAKEDYFSQKFQEENKKLQKMNLKIAMLWEITWPTITFLVASTEVFAFIFGGKLVLQEKLTLGQLIMTIQYIWALLGPFMSIGWSVQIIQRATISSNRIYQVLNYEPLVSNPDSGVKSYPQGKIELRNLNFVYHDGNSEVLKDVSLTIEKGQIIGVLGALASGKSTLIKSLTKLVNIEDGQIFYDGIDINKYDLSHLRRGIGVVPQVSFLFSDTIRNNITFAVDMQDEQVLQRVSEISTLSRDLRLFSDGYDTEIGERGVTLSGGQKQRVAIARAVASEPNILILDDSMSAVDTETEEKILKSIFKEREGKTTIIISYRISTLKNCDKIFALKDGMLIEEGTHKELMVQNGFYKKIFDLQSLQMQE